MTNQASEDIRNHISRNICHEAYGSEYEELTSLAKWTHDGLVDEIIMPAINALIRTEKLKLLAEVREQTTIFKIKAHDKKGQPHLYEAGRGVPTEVVDKLEAEL